MSAWLEQRQLFTLSVNNDQELADFLLTATAEPLLQQLSLDDSGGEVNLETIGVGTATEPRKKVTKKKVA